MRVLFLMVLMMTQTINAASSFRFSAEESICGMTPTGQQNDDLQDEFQAQADAQCAEEGFKAAYLSEIEFSALPFSWGTIGCTPISHHFVSGIKECF